MSLSRRRQKKEVISMSKKMKIKAAQFVLGGLGYGILEIFWRGCTHVSMLITGGTAFCVLLSLSKLQKKLWQLCLLGGAVITALELMAGCIVNLWLGLDVWDYSKNRLNVRGQICPLYSFLWCGLCAVIFTCCRLCRGLRHRRRVF